MSLAARGLVLCAVQVGLVLSLGGKLLLDRETLPRVWAHAAPFDPNLPIRGRYVRLRVEAHFAEQTLPLYREVTLRAENSRLVAYAATEDSSVTIAEVSGMGRAWIAPAVAFFIPEHVPDPSRRALGEELWVEVTVPKQGPPRPIRLGVKREGGEIVPLSLD